MPNWDLVCTTCGDVGSYLDFPPKDPEKDHADVEPDERDCLFCKETGAEGAVDWRD